MVITSKFGTPPVAALAVIILGASATIMMMTSMTTIAAFAQPTQQQQRGGAIPEGFQLNRGVCRAEATLTCENYNVEQSWTHIDENGHCIVRESTIPVCVYDEETGQILEYYDYFYMSCREAGTGTLTDSEPKCEYPFQPEHPINDSTLEYT